MQFVYSIVLSSGSYDSCHETHLRAYSSREAALKQIDALAAEMLKFETHYKKTAPRAKFGVRYTLTENSVELHASETSSWGKGSRLPAFEAMCKHIASSQIGKEFHPEMWSGNDPFDGDFTLSIEALPLYD